MTHRSIEAHDATPFSVEMLLGRDELDDIAVHRAIGRRLREAGLNLPVDRVLADAAKGEDWALDILQTVELPAPSKRLTMPVQDLARNGSRHGLDALWSRFAFRARRHA